MPDSARPGSGPAVLLTGVAVAACNLLLAAVIVRLVGTSMPDVPQGALAFVAVLGAGSAAGAAWQWRRYLDGRRVHEGGRARER